MTATWFTGNPGFGEERWLRMLVLSFLFHAVVFSTVLFIPKNGVRYPSLRDRVYHVELVGPPSRGALKSARPAPPSIIGKQANQIRRAQTQRITVKQKKKVPALAKRVSPKRKEKPEEKTASPSGLIDEALSRIKRRVTEQKQAEPEQTPIEPIENEKLANGSGILSQGVEQGSSGVPSETGKVLAVYQMEIEATIKNNWAYPVALLNAQTRQGPEAVVVLTVRNDGKILSSWFKNRSHDPLFDDSVQKAIEKSDPLPPFPPGYQKSYDEVEISFSLKDLV
jgi:colicin import membrane protein